MNKQMTLAALLAASLMMTACAKKENAPATEAAASAAVEQPVVDEKVSAEQQAIIDSIDQPILDERNTDIPAEVANAPADAATPFDSKAAASEVVAP